MNVERYIHDRCATGQKMLAVLLDPEKLTAESDICRIGSLIGRHRPDFVFVGGSTFFSSSEPLVRALRPYIGAVPVVLFPGHPLQFTPEADALLFLTLISGNNPDALIGQQVMSARKVKESGIETISMGYILVDGGKQSAAARATNTSALPASDPQVIADTALAGEMLGLHSIYLEAGSGADVPAGAEIIAGVRSSVACPLIVGGGIRRAEQAVAAWQAGADIVVVGNHLESSPEDLPLFTSARNDYNNPFHL